MQTKCAHNGYTHEQVKEKTRPHATGQKENLILFFFFLLKVEMKAQPFFVSCIICNITQQYRIVTTHALGQMSASASTGLFSMYFNTEILSPLLKRILIPANKLKMGYVRCTIKGKCRSHISPIYKIKIKYL